MHFDDIRVSKGKPWALQLRQSKYAEPCVLEEAVVLEGKGAKPRSTHTFQFESQPRDTGAVRLAPLLADVAQGCPGCPHA